MDEATDLRATLDAIAACEPRLTPAGADDIRAGAAKLLARAERDACAIERIAGIPPRAWLPDCGVGDGAVD